MPRTKLSLAPLSVTFRNWSQDQTFMWSVQLDTAMETDMGTYRGHGMGHKCILKKQERSNRIIRNKNK